MFKSVYIKEKIFVEVTMGFSRNIFIYRRTQSFRFIQQNLFLNELNVARPIAKPFDVSRLFSNFHIQMMSFSFPTDVNGPLNIRNIALPSYSYYGNR